MMSFYGIVGLIVYFIPGQFVGVKYKILIIVLILLTIPFALLLGYVATRKKKKKEEAKSSKAQETASAATGDARPTAGAQSRAGAFIGNIPCPDNTLVGCRGGRVGTQLHRRHLVARQNELDLDVDLLASKESRQRAKLLVHAGDVVAARSPRSILACRGHRACRHRRSFGTLSSGYLRGHERQPRRRARHTQDTFVVYQNGLSRHRSACYVGSSRARTRGSVSSRAPR